MGEEKRPKACEKRERFGGERGLAILMNPPQNKVDGLQSLEDVPWVRVLGSTFI
jgi:hypothetical protein